MNRRVRLRLRGIVQGVGFRPAVFHVAQSLGLAGFVQNTSAGLVAEAEGAAEAVDRFVKAICQDPPPLAWIQHAEIVDLPPAGETGFAIRGSEAQADEFALIAPDVATCAACLRELRDPVNRRHGYAFTNCTHCGPRYTIVEDIPYDRPNTTMAKFRMCAACQAEYENPADRRFHAQPNACPACGPALSAAAAKAIERLARGEILAIKGLGGFHLACDARNREAIERLRGRKRRSEKPFALMCRDAEAAARLCAMSAAERRTLESPERPILILRRRPECQIPGEVAPGNRTLGIMLPCTPLHHLLFQDAPFDTLVMTSGNRSEEPIVTRNEEARERLSGVAGWFLTHDRDIFMRTDDSVVRHIAGTPRVLRRSRGYAPRTIELGRELPELLAVGGELKNAFCLTKGRHAILSQHIGDLENYETLAFFEETLANLKKLFRVAPRAVAYDLHPGYLSTKFAQAIEGLPKIGVQHHHAHIAACMAENGLEGDAIGVAFDGTGYGTDGQIWGGEFLAAGYGGFARRARFRYVPLAGGDAAVREPWRAALAYLIDTFGEGFDDLLRGVPEARVRVVRQMIARRVNTVDTSSCGRLFDAVAAILGLRREVTFEGQAAIELEAVAHPCETGRYDFATPRVGDGWEVDFRPTIAMIACAVRAGEDCGTIAARFHNTISDAAEEICRLLREETGIARVCLSGGTFQNVRLTEQLTTALREDGFEVYLHARVPPNDGGIALGQAAVAAALL
ncbi:MAG TPA: carbamoyltransferase HypF [Bryobacteraceae bacterium]|nr:carbamoyltransferase HypF [Bryobacteraceae bacterium]